MRRVLIGLVLAVTMAFGAWAQASWLGLNNSLVRFALEQVSTPGSFEVKAGAVEEPDDGSLVLRDVTVSDRSGVWLRAGTIAVQWNASRVLRGELELPLLRIADLDISRLPDDDAEAPTLKPGEETESGFVWPRSPITVRVDRLELTNVRLARGVVPQEITFDAAGTGRDEGDIQSVALEVTRRDAIEGRIDFDYLRDFASNTLRLRLDADEAAGGLVAALAGFPETSPAQLRLNAEGPETDWRLTFAARVYEVFEAEGEATVAYVAPISVETAFTLTPGALMPKTARDALSPRSTLAARLTEMDGVVSLESLAVQAPVAELTASGTFRRDDQTLGLQTRIVGNEGLSALVDAVTFDGFTFDGALSGTPDDLDAKGSVTLDDLKTAPADARALTLDVTANRTDARLVFSARGGGEGLRLDRVTPDLLGQANLELDGILRGSVLELAQGKLESALLSANAAGTLDLERGGGEIRYGLTTVDATPVARLYGVDLSGALKAKGTLRQDEDMQLVTGDVVAQAVFLDGVRYGDLTLKHDVSLGEVPNGTLSLNAPDTVYGPVRLATRFAFDAPRLTLSDLEADALSSALAGSLDVDTEASLLDGTLTYSSRDLSVAGRQLGLMLSGTANGRVILRPVGQTQSVEATVRGPRLTVNDISLSGLSLDGNVADVLGTPVVDTAFTADTIALDTARLSNARIVAKGPTNALAISVSSGGTVLDKPITLATAMRLSVSPELSGTISTLRLSLGDDVFSLQKPATLRQRGQRQELRGVDLALPDGGRVAGDLGFDGGVFGTVLISAVELELIDRLVGGLNMTGRVDAEAKFDTRRAQAELRAGLSEFEPGLNLRRSAPLAAQMTINWRGPTADVQASISGDFGDPVSASLRVPVRRSLPLPSLNRSGALSGSLKWSGEIARLWSAVPAAGTLLSGPVAVDLAVSGTPARPSVGGVFNLTKGRLEQLTAGLLLTDLTIDSRADSNGNLSLTLNALDGADGVVEGTLGLENRSGLNVNARLRAQRAILVRRDDLIARLTTDIAVTGPLNDLLVGGTIDIDEAEARLLNTSPPEVIALDDIRFRGEPEPVEDVAGAGLITLDLAVRAPGRIYVRGRGLDSEWKANLQIGGTSATPRIRGLVERLRGSFSLIGKNFDLETGRVRFDGGAEIDPDLNISLARTDNDLTGRIQVTGRASDPQVAFVSTPVLPSGEILPRLLFGQSRQSLTPSQALQLAVGIQTLTSGKAGALDVAREALGVDVLQVDPGEDGDTSIKVGKTLAPGVFIGAKKDVSGGKNDAVTVEIDIFEGFKIEGETQADRSTLGITWKRDF